MASEKILIVDDEKDFITTVKFFLEKNGYEVANAETGAEAIEKSKDTPDIILLDLRLPDMTGFDILHKLHMNPATQRIPVIILTASADIKFLREAQDLRATDYLMKTESFERILASVKKYIGLYKNGRDIFSEDNKTEL